ncbi:MAG: CHAD domain-containing protein [Pseudomonadales bacterium]|nr:CHAD domain-containing protein [Pseudomonadales bacterium]
MTIEIELKLQLPKAQNRRFKQWLKTNLPHAEGPALEHQVSIYYDTQALDLAHQGMGLRLRRQGNHWIQTLKLRQLAGAGLHQHQEFDTLVSGQTLELNHLDPGPASDFLCSPAIHGALKPLFQTDIKRNTWMVTREPDTRIEIALDSGYIISGTRSQPINEIELELIQGDLQAVYDLGEQLAQHLRMALQHRNKAEQGYLLYVGHVKQPVPTHPPEPLLSPLTESRQAMQTIALANLQYLQDQLSGVLTMPELLEPVHQAHVALRRLRSLRKAFSKVVGHERWNALLPDLQWLMEKIGQVRDLDVFLEEILYPMEQIPAFKSPLAPIRQLVNEQRHQRFEELDWAISSARTTILLLRLLAWITLPLPQQTSPSLERLAHQALERTQKKVHRSIHDLSLLSAEQRHTLRKDLKTLRYSVEFFASLFKQHSVKRYLQPMQALQTSLGSLNDSRSAKNLIDLLLQQQPELSSATDLILGWIAHKESQANQQAEAATYLWIKTKPCW